MAAVMIRQFHSYRTKTRIFGERLFLPSCLRDATHPGSLPMLWNAAGGLQTDKGV